MKMNELFSLEPVYDNKLMLLPNYLLRYTQYAFITMSILVLFFFTYFLLYLLISAVIIMIICLIIISINSADKEQSLIFVENEIILLSREKRILKRFNQIHEIQFLISSYKDRSALLSFWKEWGYNQLIIKSSKGYINFIFQLHSIKQYNDLIDCLKNIENSNKCSYPMVIKKRFT